MIYHKGDRFTFIDNCCAFISKGSIVTITKDHPTVPFYEDENRHDCLGHERSLVKVGRINNEDNKEKKSMSKRTFKQLRETPTIRKGALWQEECDDGTQPYSMITPEFCKSTKNSVGAYTDRKLVEDQPEWFEEVYKVQPEYMNAADLERYKAFVNGQLNAPVKRSVGRPRKGISTAIKPRTVRTPMHTAEYWTPERRAAQSKKIKAAIRRKRRALNR